VCYLPGSASQGVVVVRVLHDRARDLSLFMTPGGSPSGRAVDTGQCRSGDLGGEVRPRTHRPSPVVEAKR